MKKRVVIKKSPPFLLVQQFAGNKKYFAIQFEGLFIYRSESSVAFVEFCKQNQLNVCRLPGKYQIKFYNFQKAQSVFFQMVLTLS